MKGWLALIAGVILVCVGLYYLNQWLGEVNFFADK